MRHKYPDPRGSSLLGGIQLAVSIEIDRVVNLIRDSALDVATHSNLMKSHIGGQALAPLVSDVLEFRARCHETVRSCKVASNHSRRIDEMLGMFVCTHENLEWEGTEPFCYRISCDCGVSGKAEMTPGGYLVKLD